MFRRLIPVGCATAVIYILQFLAYGSAFFPHSIDPPVFREVLSWATAIALLALYWLGYRRLAESLPNRSLTLAILIFATLFATAAAITFPFHSTDVFVYVAGGWEQTHYQLNPYSHVLRDIPGIANDPMIMNPWLASSTNPWMDQPFTYGFAFGLLTRVLAWAGHGNWALTVLFFQALNLAVYGATALVLWSVAHRLGCNRPDLLLYLFTWSPLVLIHHVTNAHNDLLIGFLFLIAGWAFIVGALFWIIPALALAGLIKYVGFILLPTAVVHVIKHKGWKYAALSAATAAVLVLAISAPYLSEARQFRISEMLAQMTNTKDSLSAFLYYVYRLITRSVPGLGFTLESFGMLTKNILWLSYFVLLVYRLGSYVRKRETTAQDAILECCLLLSALIGVVSTQFYAWYIGMVFPLLLLIPKGHWLWRAGMIASCLHVLSITSLMRKGIGYFLLTTMLALICTWVLEARRRIGLTRQAV